MKFLFQLPLLIAISIISLQHVVVVSLPNNETVPAVIVFGDSIVDPGNNKYINTMVQCNFPPYGREFGGGNQPTGRFSNGLVPSDIIGTKIPVIMLSLYYIIIIFFLPKVSYQFLLICSSFSFKIWSQEALTSLP